MKHSDYWRKRFEQLEEAQLNKGAAYYADLEKQYKLASKRIEDQISGWYNRFAHNNQISFSEAKLLLNSKELKEFKWSVQEYIKRGKENAVTGEWMKQLENASAKVHISRLEALKLQLQQQCEVLYGNQVDGLDKTMRKIYGEGYYHTAYEIQKGLNVGYDLHKLNETQVSAVISKPWAADGKNFINRCWTDKAKLVNTLHTELTQGIIRGDAPDQAIKTIAQKFNTSKANAGRLVMTESAFFASAAQQDCFNDLGVEKYEIVATLDRRTSLTCRHLDGKVFDMKDYKVGTTAPPFHVRCRSVTVPYFDDNVGGSRAARNENGKTYYVPDSMKYPEWEKSFVDGGRKEGLQELSNGDTLKLDDSISGISKRINDMMQFKNGVDLTGVAPEVALSIEDSYTMVVSRYPQLKGEFKGLSSDAKGCYADCFPHNGSIRVNKFYFGDLDKIARTYERDLKTNFHPAGTTWEAIITHELGHAIDGYLTRNGVVEMSKGFNVKSASYVIRKKVLKDLKLTKKHVESEVSKYATKEDAEFLAECFAEYMHSESPRRVARAVGEMIDDLMEGVKKNVAGKT